MCKKDGTKFQSLSLNHVVAEVMRFNGKPELDFYKDVTFAGFRQTLDAEIKQLKSAGETRKRQAEPISVEEEEKLWTLGLLGDHSPQALVDTMLFYIGLYFALRSGGEHRQLQRNPCQIELIEKSGKLPYLRYTDDISKNRPGGLKGSRVSPKLVVHHANKYNRTRCFI